MLIRESRLHEPFLREIVSIMKPYSNVRCDNEEELLIRCCYFWNNVVSAYLNEHNVSELSSAMQNELLNCLFKHACFRIGEELASISETDPLYEKIKHLSEGV